MINRNDICELVTATNEKNEYGVYVTSETKRRVYCNVQSVTRYEFFAAGDRNIKPVYRIEMFYYDYSGEHIVDYGGRRYKVYRTYQPTKDTVEIYLKEAIGDK